MFNRNFSLIILSTSFRDYNRKKRRLFKTPLPPTPLGIPLLSLEEPPPPLTELESTNIWIGATWIPRIPMYKLPACSNINSELIRRLKWVRIDSFRSVELYFVKLTKWIWNFGTSKVSLYVRRGVGGRMAITVSALGGWTKARVPKRYAHALCQLLLRINVLLCKDWRQQ